MLSNPSSTLNHAHSSPTTAATRPPLFVRGFAFLFPHGFPQIRLGLRSSGGVHVYIAIKIWIELLENRNQGFNVIVSRLPRNRQREVALEEHLLLGDVRDHQAV